MDRDISGQELVEQLMSQQPLLKDLQSEEPIKEYLVILSIENAIAQKVNNSKKCKCKS